MEQDKIFAEKKNRSPEKLNEYIRIGSTGGLLLIIGLIIMAAALVVWGVVGRIPVTNSQIGAIVEDDTGVHTCLCFVDVNEPTGIILEGSPVTVRTIDGKIYNGEVVYMMPNAASADEIKKAYANINDESGTALSEWVMENLLGNSKYCYPLYIHVDEDLAYYWHEVADVTIVLDKVQPISYLLR